MSSRQSVHHLPGLTLYYQGHLITDAAPRKSVSIIIALILDPLRARKPFKLSQQQVDNRNPPPEGKEQACVTMLVIPSRGL